ncbi:TPR end-of-group domain-containing protein [Pyxidicoccus sp. MSG2]|uniref:TPR end-of-group domain-containing protein n=1 Tax=Pyxidicoccus sp. MSG2 TaxID=2996790 RepID=UPI00226D548E|nr:tetratricopeptide repeat protein [Pyxidicoccus sp. MSG2]MCY1019716.1 tetratricopeptide repeat protein [Pyxidicoccus sp. MSG2]
MRLPTSALLLVLAGACAHAPASTETPTAAAKAPVAELPFMEPPAAPMPGWQLVKRGDVLMREGRHAEALAEYTRALDAGNTNDGTAYSAACALALLGKKQEALDQLSRAAEWGFRDVRWMQQDEDLASLRTEPAFTALVARIPTLPEKDPTAHAELKRMFAEDQADRSPPPASPEAWKAVTARDEQRRARVKELVAAGELKEGADFLAAAFIFQHGHAQEDFAMARELGAEAARRGHPGGLWIAAAAWDRWLMNAERPQRFGTQYRGDLQTKQMKLYPVDPSVTDEERARWGFPPLAEIPTTLR